jgi:hypothetical protein
MKILTATQINLLKEAIREANGWRGTMLGNPDPRPLAFFDANIQAMRAALKIVEEQQSTLRKIRKCAKVYRTKMVFAYCELEGGGRVDIGHFEIE